jgi:hypothetical protein
MVPTTGSNKNNTNSGSCDDTFTMVIYRFKLDQKQTVLLLDYLLEDKVSNMKNETQPITFAKGFGGISDMKVRSDRFL